MSDTRLLRALKALLPSVFPREPFLGPRRYRLVRMRPSASSVALTRAELQIVQAATGLPDLLVVSVWPGLAGVLSELTPGSIVLVQFIDGDRSQPFISHVATADDPAWRPVTTRIDATTSISIGAASSPAAARVGDASDCGSLTVAGAAGSVTITYTPPVGSPTVITLAATGLTAVVVPPGPIALVSKIASGSAKTVIE